LRRNFIPSIATAVECAQKYLVLRNAEKRWLWFNRGISAAVILSWVIAAWLDKPWWGMIILTIAAGTMARVCWNNWEQVNEDVKKLIKEMGEMPPGE
jgi:hypothetical protein